MRKEEKFNLEMLRFTVGGENDTTGDQLYSGSHREVIQYLTDHGTEFLEVHALDLEEQFSFEPIPADKWLNWYDLFVIPALKENNFDDDLLIEYPNAGMDLGELDNI